MGRQSFLKIGILLVILSLGLSMRTHTAKALTFENVRTWYWTDDTQIVSVAVGDVDGDAKKEVVTGGFYLAGSYTYSQLCVWNGATLALKSVRTWLWAYSAGIESVAIGDVDGDGKVEIVTGGSYDTGATLVAQLCVWNGATLALKGVRTWYWTHDTYILSVAVGDVDGDGKNEIVTGGVYNDWNRDYAQLCVWNGATLALENDRTWIWGTTATSIRSVAVDDVDSHGKKEIVTGGSYNDDSTHFNFAQLCVWNGATLGLKNVQVWRSGTSATQRLTSVTIGDVDGDGSKEIVTGGWYWYSVHNVAELCVWNGATLALKDTFSWIAWHGGVSTICNSVAVGEVDGDGKNEIATGGYWEFISENYYRAQLCVWDCAPLTMVDSAGWYWGSGSWGSGTYINSVGVADVDADGKADFVTGGYYYDGTRNVAQLCVWG